MSETLAQTTEQRVFSLLESAGAPLFPVTIARFLSLDLRSARLACVRLMRDKRVESIKLGREFAYRKCAGARPPTDGRGGGPRLINGRWHTKD